MTETAANVRFDAVEKRFGTFQALHSLTLEIEPGSLFALLGPSGCGKTTTLRLIAGFEQASAGRIHIGGQDVTERPAYRRNFGMVFQNFALFPHLSVAQNVAFGLEMRRVPKRDIAPKVASALDLVALGAFAERYPSELSGGQQQRVALARAIVFEPDVLLLDEPMSALDKMLREQMQVEIRDLQKRLGMTTVFVTHDQDEALTMADRIAVMRDGRLLQTGAPRDIYERPGSAFVATFLGASNLLEARVQGHDAEGLQVQIAGISLPVIAPVSHPVSRPGAGHKVQLSLRPERIGIDPASPLQAIVTGIIYRGAQCQVGLDLAGQSLNAVLPSAVTAGLEPGQQIGLAVPRDALILLEA